MSDENLVGKILAIGAVLFIVLPLAITIVGTIIMVFVSSLVIGLFISLFVGLVSAIRNSIVGINKSVTNKFMKVTLFAVIGLVILAVIVPVGFEAYTLIVSMV